MEASHGQGGLPAVNAIRIALKISQKPQHCLQFPHAFPLTARFQSRALDALGGRALRESGERDREENETPEGDRAALPGEKLLVLGFHNWFAAEAVSWGILTEKPLRRYKKREENFGFLPSSFAASALFFSGFPRCDRFGLKYRSGCFGWFEF